MWHLYQFPLCPFSRKVRLLLGEKAVAYNLVTEFPWEERDEYFDINPTGMTPALTDPEKGIKIADSRAICEYIDETVEAAPMMNGPSLYRAEIRRLVAWFDERFFIDVTAPLMQERLRKRVIYRSPPDATVLREAMRAANAHLDYIDYLIDTRSWLAGATMSMADLAAAAQISVADYLGGIDWQGHEQTRAWYAMFKSRPSFRPLLSERMGNIPPPSYYEKVDF
jgi:glutathione S-transferase